MQKLMMETRDNRHQSIGHISLIDIENTQYLGIFRMKCLTFGTCVRSMSSQFLICRSSQILQIQLDIVAKELLLTHVETTVETTEEGSWPTVADVLCRGRYSVSEYTQLGKMPQQSLISQEKRGPGYKASEDQLLSSFLVELYLGDDKLKLFIVALA